MDHSFTLTSFSASSLCRCLDFNNACAEKPASHKYVVAKGKHFLTQPRRSILKNSPTGSNEYQNKQENKMRIWIIDIDMVYRINQFSPNTDFFFQLKNGRFPVHSTCYTIRFSTKKVFFSIFFFLFFLNKVITEKSVQIFKKMQKNLFSIRNYNFHIQNFLECFFRCFILKKKLCFILVWNFHMQIFFYLEFSLSEFYIQKFLIQIIFI